MLPLSSCKKLHHLYLTHWKSTQGSHELITDVVSGPTLAELTNVLSKVQLGQMYYLLSSFISSSMCSLIPTQSPWYHSLQWSQQIVKQCHPQLDDTDNIPSKSEPQHHYKYTVESPLLIKSELYPRF